MTDNKLKIDSSIPGFSLTGVDDKTYTLNSVDVNRGTHILSIGLNLSPHL